MVSGTRTGAYTKRGCNCRYNSSFFFTFNSYNSIKSVFICNINIFIYNVLEPLLTDKYIPFLKGKKFLSLKNVLNFILLKIKYYMSDPYLFLTI